MMSSTCAECGSSAWGVAVSEVVGDVGSGEVAGVWRSAHDGYDWEKSHGEDLSETLLLGLRA